MPQERPERPSPDDSKPSDWLPFQGCHHTGNELVPCHFCLDRMVKAREAAAAAVECPNCHQPTTAAEIAAFSGECSECWLYHDELRADAISADVAAAIAAEGGAR